MPAISASAGESRHTTSLAGRRPSTVGGMLLIAHVWLRVASRLQCWWPIPPPPPRARAERTGRTPDSAMLADIGWLLNYGLWTGGMQLRLTRHGWGCWWLCCCSACPGGGSHRPRLGEGSGQSVAHGDDPQSVPGERISTGRCEQRKAVPGAMPCSPSVTRTTSCARLSSVRTSMRAASCWPMRSRPPDPT